MPSAAHRDSEQVDALDDELLTGEAVALDLRSTSFVLRGAGAMIDFTASLVALILGLLLLIEIGTALDFDEATATAASVALTVIVLVVIPTAVETLTKGKSLGRLAVGSRIVRDDGGAIGFRHAFIRALSGVLELYFTLGGLAAMAGLLNGRAKRIGDLLAGTYAQYERVSRVAPPVFGVPLPLVEWAKTADVATLPDALGRRIAQFLSQASSLTPETRSKVAAELAREASVFVSPIPESDAELFLAAVTAVRRDREFAAHTLQQRGLATLAPVLTGLPHGFPDR